MQKKQVEQQIRRRVSMIRCLGFSVGLAVAILGCSEERRALTMVNEPSPVVSVKPVGQIDAEVLNDLAEDLAATLRVRCATSSAMLVPERSLDPARHQYLATGVMAAARPRTPAELLLLVIDEDLFVPSLNFVFGVGDPQTRVAIISLVRLRQETYGLPSEPELYRRRALTEAVHELGHVFGLGHCNNRNCVMTFSNSLQDTDRKGPDFCDACRRSFKRALSSFRRPSGAES